MRGLAANVPFQSFVGLGLLLVLRVSAMARAHDLNREELRCIRDSKEPSALQRWLECLQPPPPPPDAAASGGSAPPPTAMSSQAVAECSQNSSLDTSSEDEACQSSSLHPLFTDQAISLSESGGDSIANIPSPDELNSGFEGRMPQDSGRSIADRPSQDAQSSSFNIQSQDERSRSFDERMPRDFGQSTIGQRLEQRVSQESGQFVTESIVQQGQDTEGDTTVDRGGDTTVDASQLALVTAAVLMASGICRKINSRKHNTQTDRVPAAAVVSNELGKMSLDVEKFKVHTSEAPNPSQEVRLQGADIAVPNMEAFNGAQKSFHNGGAADSQSCNLGVPLGSAVGAVLAEVLLHTSCQGQPCAPAEHLSLLLETAIMESLPQVIPDGSKKVLEDFLASFSSTYKVIQRVHKAFSKDGRDGGTLHQWVRETACACNEIEHKGSVNSEQLHYLNTKAPYISNTEDYHPEWRTTVSVKKSMIDQLTENEVIPRLPPHLDETESRLHVRDAEQNPDCKDVLDEVDTPVKMENSGKLCGGRNKEQAKLQELTHEEDCPSLPSLYSNTGKSTNMACQKFQSYESNGQGFMKNDQSHVEHSYVEQANISSGQDAEARRMPLSNGFDDRLERWVWSTGGERATPRFELQNDDASSVTEDQTKVVQPTVGLLDTLVLAGPSTAGVQASWQKTILNIFEKSVRVQEQHNYIKSVELAHLFRRLTLDEEQLQLTSVSNQLMRENLSLSRSKANFKESTALEHRMIAVHVEFRRTCADELVAGLFVMLLSLAYGVKKYSFTLLSDMVSTCHPAVKERHRSSGFHINWLYNSLDGLVGQLQYFTCQVTVTGRIFIGLLIVLVVATSLLRQSVTSSSQSMPTTILIIVLGGVCGFAGKLSVDSLGGDGFRWLIVWEVFCTVHALATCFTPFVYRLLHGRLSRSRFKFGIPYWLRKFTFHATMVLLLPVLAGQLPFGSFSSVMNDLLLILLNNVSPVFTSVLEWTVV